MSIESIALRVHRAALKRRAFTAGELAERAGFSSGRAIARALGALVAEGSLVASGGRYPTYIKAA